MFGFGQTVTKPAPLPKQKASTKGYDEYVALARELGVGYVAKLDVVQRQRQVVDFLWEEGVELYDFKHVERYLNGVIARESRKIGWSLRLVWRGLRECDRNNQTIYGKPVPHEILAIVKKLVDKFPGSRAQDPRLHFFVSDYEVVNPDPFIMVRLGDDGDPIVFGVWDEPGYSMIKGQ